MLAIYRVNDSL